MAKRDAQKLAAGLAELAKINARETEVQKAARLEKTNKYMDTYKVNPKNWLARLGQRDAQKFVLRHPTSQDVSSWKTPLPYLFGITGDDLHYISDPKQRAKEFNIWSDQYAKKNYGHLSGPLTMKPPLIIQTKGLLLKRFR